MNYEKHFNKHKSPNRFTILKDGKMYQVKHNKSNDSKLIWDSSKKGTYNKSIHGEIGLNAKQ